MQPLAVDVVVEGEPRSAVLSAVIRVATETEVKRTRAAHSLQEAEESQDYERLHGQAPMYEPLMFSLSDEASSCHKPKNLSLTCVTNHRSRRQDRRGSMPLCWSEPWCDLTPILTLTLP